LFGTPAIVGILGLYFVYRDGYYINNIIGKLLNNENLLKENELIQPVYRNRGFSQKRFLFNRVLMGILIFAVIFLRLTIAFAGAEPDYYTVNVANPSQEIDLGNINPEIIKIENSTDKITYHINNTYNEMQLINDLKVPLNNSCEYYTVSWNIYSYF
jgi:hypothetical protein